MLILSLDTATEQGSLALLAADKLLAEMTLQAQGAYLVHLLPGIEALLRDAGCSLADLDAVAVSTGPGNFTGLRLGLATAKALAWSLGCPLVPVPTMEVLAAQFPRQEHPIGVLLDAKRREVFWGLFRCPQDLPQVLAEPCRLALGDLPPRLRPPLLLTGPGLTVYEAFLRDLLPPGVSLAPPEARFPRAATVARRGAAASGRATPRLPSGWCPPTSGRPCEGEARGDAAQESRRQRLMQLKIMTLMPNLFIVQVIPGAWLL